MSYEFQEDEQMLLALLSAEIFDDVLMLETFEQLDLLL